MKREKQEIIPTLKISVKAGDDLSKEFTPMQISIKEVKDIETKFGKKTVITVQAGEEEVYNLFVNSTSMNNLIDAFGDDDAMWIGKICNLVKGKNEKFENEMIVFEPVA